MTMGNGVDLNPIISPTDMRSRLRSTAGMRSSRQCREFATSNSSICSWWASDAVEEIFGKAADVGLHVVDRLPEGGAHLVRRLLADVRLKEHLHGEFAGFASSAGGQAFPLSASLRRRLTISIAATAASKPLFPGLDTGAIQGLFERFAGQHAKTVRDAGFLL